jgi:hypothetical protein
MRKDIMAKLIERGAVMKRLSDKEISQEVAALHLDRSVRQIRRMYKKYREFGSNGLIHGNYGRPSRQKKPQEMELKAVEWLKEHGPDFGSTFAQEKLIEYLGIGVSVSTVKNWQKTHGLLKRKHRTNKPVFNRRERKLHFGHMVQIDGSPHDWFQGRRSHCTLLTAIDDATGKIVARFAEEETTIDLMRLMWRYVEQFGIPHMAYTDHGGPYKVNINNAEKDKMTQLHRALDELKVKMIHANSPQAKGRVERNHGTNQDRLVKEMGLRKISTIDEANRYLEEEYLPWFNKRFAVAPARCEDIHRPIRKFNLHNVFSIHEKRIMQNDGIIQFEKQLYQVTKNRSYAQPKSIVTIRLHLDGSKTFWSGPIELGIELVSKRPQVTSKTPPVDTKQRRVSKASRHWNDGKYLPYRLRSEVVDKTWKRE